MTKEHAPWNSGEATRCVNACAQSDKLTLSWREHAKERLRERGLIMSDVLHVLKFGFVHEPAEPATRPGFYKYLIEGTTPNSHRRSVGVVVIPDVKTHQIKIVTVMWRDER